jgi:hypothetical protein
MNQPAFLGRRHFQRFAHLERDWFLVLYFTTDTQTQLTSSDQEVTDLLTIGP